MVQGLWAADMVFPSFMLGLDQRKFIVLAVLAGVLAATTSAATGAATWVLVEAVIDDPLEYELDELDELLVMMVLLDEALLAWSMMY